MLPHGPCLFLTLVLTQGQEDKARCVGRSPRGPSHSWGLEFHLPRGPQQLLDAWAGILSVLNERESSPGFSLLSSGLGMGSLDGYVGR